jgi:hypothetical protein
MNTETQIKEMLKQKYTLVKRCKYCRDEIKQYFKESRPLNQGICTDCRLPVCPEHSICWTNQGLTLCNGCLDH